MKIARLFAALWFLLVLQFGEDPHENEYDPYA